MVTLEFSLNTREAILKFNVDSHSHQPSVSSMVRVESIVKKYWKTIPSEQTIYNLISSCLGLK